MDRLGPWLNGILDHLKNHWQGHVVPTLVMMGALMVVYFVVFGCFGAVMAVGAAAEMPDWFIIVLSLLVFVMIFAMMLVIAPLQLGYIRGCLKLFRGGTFEISEYVGALRDAPGAIVMMTIIMTSAMIGAMLCYLPALIISAVFFFAFPIMADQRTGPIESLKKSVALAKPYIWVLVLYSLIMGMIMGMMAYIPIIGPLAVLPLGTTMMLVPYLDLIGETPRAGGPAEHDDADELDDEPTFD
jgi:hypothetical protein